MSKGSTGLLFGLVVGAVALTMYRRRASLQAVSGPRQGAALPPGAGALMLSGGSAMQSMFATAGGALQSLSTSIQQNGVNGIVEQARRYVDRARAQLDIAIAEGQVAAAETRKELEARFEEAKADPTSARFAFK